MILSFYNSETTLLFFTSGRAKKLDEHLNKLNKYVDAFPPKKPQQQRNELLTNERSSGATLKISQMHRNSSELGSQKFDDRSKNVGLSKRSRTSTTEPRVCKNRICLLYFLCWVLMSYFYLTNRPLVANESKIFYYVTSANNISPSFYFFESKQKKS